MSQEGHIVVVGPAAGQQHALHRALDLALGDPDLRQVVYLGDDDAIGQALERRGRSCLGRQDFLARGVELACGGGSPAELERLLGEHRAAQQLASVRRLPDVTALAVEMLGTWIALLVHDKAVLEEDDIANAHAILYGRATKPRFRRFGPRCFFTPGALSAGYIGRIQTGDGGELRLELLDLDGQPVESEVLHNAQHRVSVSS